MDIVTILNFQDIVFNYITLLLSLLYYDFHLFTKLQLESPRVVHVLHPYRQPSGKNVCSSASCSHFCVRSAVATPVCVCPDGYVISTWNASFCIVGELVM